MQYFLNYVLTVHEGKKVEHLRVIDIPQLLFSLRRF